MAAELGPTLSSDCSLHTSERFRLLFFHMVQPLHGLSVPSL